MPLDRKDVALIKGMLLRKDRQSDITAFFGGDVNSGRIAEINTGQTWPEVAAAPPESLPPPGPYFSGRQALKAADTLRAIRDLIDDAIKEIETA